MSYCRWSSDLGECDVYVYEDVEGGWTTHVAARRLRHRVPDDIRNMPLDTGEQYIAQQRALKAWRESLPCDEYPCGDTTVLRTPKDSEFISLSEISGFAGETFRSGTAEECADLLEEIRADGLNVPQYAIDALRSE